MKKKKDKKNRITIKEAIHLNYRAYKLLKKQCPSMFFSIFLVCVVSGITPYVGIYLSAQVIEELAGQRRPEQLWKLVTITILVTAVLGILNACLSRWENSRNGSYWFRKDKIYADKMLDMDYCTVVEQKIHDLRYQIKQNENWNGWGIGRVRDNIRSIIKAVIGILSAVALTVTLFTSKVPETAGKFLILNHPLFLVGMILILLFVTFVSPMIQNKGESYWVSAAEDMKFGNRIFGFFGFLGEEHDRAVDIRIYNQQNISKKYMDQNGFMAKNLNGVAIVRHAKGPMGLLYAASTMTSNVFTGFVYVYVCLKAWAGAFGVGAVTQYVGAATTLAMNVSTLISCVGGMYNNADFLRTTMEYMDIPNPMYQGSLTTEKRSDRNYEVEFRNVSFKYPGTEEYALRNVSMKFKVGSRLAVVGRNGSGKTTFIKLLCRLYDPTEGEILLNGIDIRKYDYDDYIRICSVVFQDFRLLALKLGENIGGGSSYDKERVLDCLERAGFTERLASMPDGLDSYLYKNVSEKGVEISKGEAQKLAIARALYKDAPFIILDEPTAALDPLVEAEIYAKFNDIVGDKTAVYISHRLSSCRFCDEIMVFDQGRLVQQGKHDTLVGEQDGMYYSLWNAQAQYYTV